MSRGAPARTYGDAKGALLNEIMLEQSWWNEGLPIATGGVSTGTRYGK